MTPKEAWEEFKKHKPSIANWYLSNDGSAILRPCEAGVKENMLAGEFLTYTDAQYILFCYKRRIELLGLVDAASEKIMLLTEEVNNLRMSLKDKVEIMDKQLKDNMRLKRLLKKVQSTDIFEAKSAQEEIDKEPE